MSAELWAARGDGGDPEQLGHTHSSFSLGLIFYLLYKKIEDIIGAVMDS